MECTRGLFLVDSLIITAVVVIVLTVGLNYVQARFNIVINNQLKKRMIAHVLSAKKQHVEKYHTET